VCVTYNTKDAKVYLDGHLISESEIGTKLKNAIDTPFLIGASVEGSAHHFNGAIDDVYIYNRVLTAKEIKKNFL
jgi:hypothetical protein